MLFIGVRGAAVKSAALRAMRLLRSASMMLAAWCFTLARVCAMPVVFLTQPSGSLLGLAHAAERALAQATDIA